MRKRVSQTIKIALALFVAVFANGMIPSAVAYAAVEAEEAPTSFVEPVVVGETTTLQSETDIKAPLDEAPLSSDYVSETGDATTRAGIQESLLAKSNPEPEQRYKWTPPSCKTGDIYIISKNSNMTEVKVGLSFTAIFQFKKCTVSLNSYETQGPTWETSGNQTFLDHDQITLSIHNTKHTLKVDAPKCFGQTDLYLGSTLYDGVDGPLPHYPQPVVPHNLIDYWNGGAACEIPVPETPGAKDPCGLDNAYWKIPADTEQIDWSLTETGELVANAKPGYVFEGQEYSLNYGKAVDSGKLCPVTPKAPKFIDACGNQKDYVHIPYVHGVVYKINGTVAGPGYHAVSDNVVIVSAEAKSENYELVGESQGPWNFIFKDDACVTITKTSLPVTDTNKDGVIGVGDTVTWEITVTNNSTNKFENFRVQISDETATLTGDGLIPYLAPNKSETIYATSTLTTDDMQVCKAVNTATFFAWNKSHKWYPKHNQQTEDFRSIVDMKDKTKKYHFEGSATAEASFTCPTPGSGGSGEPETPVLPTPDVLPATGPLQVGSPLLTLAAAAIAYGATFFLQQRRNLSPQTASKQ